MESSGVSGEQFASFHAHPVEAAAPASPVAEAAPAPAPAPVIEAAPATPTTTAIAEASPSISTPAPALEAAAPAPVPMIEAAPAVSASAPIIESKPATPFSAPVVDAAPLGETAPATPTVPQVLEAAPVSVIPESGPAQEVQVVETSATTSTPALENLPTSTSPVVESSGNTSAAESSTPSAPAEAADPPAMESSVKIASSTIEPDAVPKEASTQSSDPIVETPSFTSSGTAEKTGDTSTASPATETVTSNPAESSSGLEDNSSAKTVESAPKISSATETKDLPELTKTGVDTTSEKSKATPANSPLTIEASAEAAPAPKEVTAATQEQTLKPESKERGLDPKEVLIRKALDNNLELLPETPENKAERESNQQLVKFIEYVQQNPDKALEWPGESAREVPSWIHAFFQDSGTPEEIAKRNPRDLMLNSNIYDLELNGSTLQKLFRTKNALREDVSQYIGNDASGREGMQATKFLHMLGKSITEQAYALHTLQKAQKNISEYAPSLAVKLPVDVQVTKFNGAEGAYFGKLNDQHLVHFKTENTPSLKELDTETAASEINVSVMEHELVHAGQGEVFAPKSAVDREFANPIVDIPKNTHDALKEVQAEQQVNPDDVMLFDKVYKEGADTGEKLQESTRLVKALLEGSAVIGQVSVLNKKIENAPNDTVRKNLESAKQQVLRTLRAGLTQDVAQAIQTQSKPAQEAIRGVLEGMKEKKKPYIEGRRLYAKLYKEFGVEQLPTIFSALDFNTITKLKATPELMQTYIDDPRLLPGLEKLPMIQESLKKTPPTVKPPEGK